MTTKKPADQKKPNEETKREQPLGELGDNQKKPDQDDGYHGTEDHQNGTAPRQ